MILHYGAHGLHHCLSSQELSTNLRTYLVQTEGEDESKVRFLHIYIIGGILASEVHGFINEGNDFFSNVTMSYKDQTDPHKLWLH